tara:strand:- start:107 stop:1144 length:1038 start_codon:yes stop_codon:yes gene_type:complete
MSKIKIACLPVAGKENPYQLLMIKGLNSSDKIFAFNGIHDRFFGIFRTWLKHKPDYIHFDWISSYFYRRNLFLTLVSIPLFYFQILFISKFTITKIVWTAHNLLPHNNRYPNIDRLIKIFFAKQVEWIRIFSKKSIASFSKNYNVRKDKFIIVPEGCYSSLYKNNTSRSESRTKLGLDKDEFILLSLGLIKPYKGLENLIKSFKKNRFSNQSLLIVGKSMDKMYFKKIKSLARFEDSIKLMDMFVEPDHLQLYFNAADVVVLPFNSIENSGSVIMAMGFSKPVLAPKMGVIVDRLSMQKELLYEDLDVGLKYALKLDRDKLIKYGKQNFNALSQYRWEDFSCIFT